jgi:uncharacterized membrane protein
MIRRHLDLILLLILATTVVVFGIVGADGGIVIKLAGAVFVLFAPGYAVTAAVFKEDVLELPAKIALGIGISLAIAAVGGIALYGTGALLTRTSWTAFLSIVILIGSIVAVIQRSRNVSYTPKDVTRKFAFSEMLLLIFGMLTLSGGIYLARTAEQNQAYEPFTEFWIVPPTEDSSEIEIGLRNYEQTTMVYDISVRINEQEVETWENISVQPDQVWSRTYTLPPKEASDETIAVYLYTDEDFTEPYRWGQLHR